MRLSRPLVNAALVQLGWFVCVLGGNLAALCFVVPFLAVHFGWVSTLRGEWKFTAVAAGAGFALDLLLLRAGVFSLAEPEFPYWLAAIWVMFATMVPHGLHWLRGRYWLAALLGAVGGVLSYTAGVELGAATADSLRLAQLAWGAEWAILMPLLVAAAAPLHSTSGAIPAAVATRP